MKQNLLQAIVALRLRVTVVVFVAIAPVVFAAEYVIQPAPGDSKDIWTTSVYSYAPGGSFPGGGQNDEKLRVGGWGDEYYSLLQFDLAGFPTNASSAVLYLYCYNQSGGGTTMYLDRITQFWDWRTQGTGRDRERLWWADRPAASQWLGSAVPNPTLGQWYAMDITSLYNAWQDGTYSNYGLQFRPVSFFNNNFNEFYSADYAGVPALRPKLVISGAAVLPPTIGVPPQNQTVLAGANATFTVTANGNTAMHYQWRKNGVNIAGANGASLTLNSVGPTASGGYSVVVWNAAGSVVSATASLAVLTDGANGSQPTQISPAPPPTKPPAVDSLVIVTHGFEPFGVLNDVSWVNSMADAIRSHAPANWLVIPYTWEGQAWVTPGFALINARIQGGVYAKELAQQNWQHVHLIGHSAGSAFVEAAAKKFKELSPSTVVHSTFLDPYLSFFQVGTSVYGANADWADCYFAQDATGNFTKGPLDNAYSVDVTWADPNKQISPIYCSSSTAGSTPPLLDQICGQRATSSHPYPHDFYFATIGGTAPGCANGYGFAMSKEGGGWNNRGNFPVGNQPLVLCGPAPLTQNPFPFNLNASLQINALPSGTSLDGVSFSGAGFSLTTHSPSWLAVGVTVSNTVNFVQFDAGFTSTNEADGLLTVYWNTNQIGMVDERVSSTNLQSYRFALPGALTNGLYTLSFRLDPMTNFTSSVTITNVKTGFTGVGEPIRLDMLLAASNNTPLLMLSGASNYNYLVQSSTNLTDWTTTALLVNTNGTVFFADPAVTNSSRRFYRATLP
ncbi:MAG: DNRLRE domain-containing protein [Verrucomicrobia bacterium]|nr:DNRLRE domain-containing protein [Verrucomicrobiota bacterium]